ncbi:MAG TPA: FecR domain-containing protein [Polyangiaceae bacterium]|jgi:hypothetical protein|nr:FecR domain-containing protein [Polyangiaceae bacterium]
MTRSVHEVPELLAALAGDADRAGDAEHAGNAPLENAASDEDVRRARIAHAIDERLARLAVVRARRRRRTFAAGLAAAFVAGAAAAFVVLRPPSSENVVATVTSDRPVELRHRGSSETTSSARLESSDELRTPSDATTTAILANGASVEVDPDSTVRFDAHVAADGAGQDLNLTHGTVSLRVPKLGPHHTLSVVTPDARVTVRGTRFSVSVLGGGDQHETRVHVTQGSVWVDHAGKEDVLSAGQTWSSRPDEASAAPATVPAATAQTTAAAQTTATLPAATLPAATAQTTTTLPTSTALPAAAPAALPTPTTSQPTATSQTTATLPTSTTSQTTATSQASATSQTAALPTSATSAVAGAGTAASLAPVGSGAAQSTLAAENELYRRAVASVRGGDDGHAVGMLDAFLGRFPRSPLAQNAEVERLRALGRLGRHDAAARAAERYLTNYPHGFASDEARRLLAPAK